MFNSKERAERAEKSYIENGGYQKCIEDLVKENLIEVLYENDVFLLARCTSQKYIIFHKKIMNKHHRLFYNFIAPIQVLNLLNTPNEQLDNNKVILSNAGYIRDFEVLKKNIFYCKREPIIPFLNRGANKRLEEKIEELKKANASEEQRDSAPAQQG